MIVWLRKQPVAIVSILQIILYTWKLNLLSPWGDEVVSLRTVRLDVSGLVHAAAIDIHPPLYYLLLHVWQALPLGLNEVVQARLLSVLFIVIATVAINQFWAKGLAANARIAVLTVWVMSPCLLLYSRMCRSYSLQVLVSILAAGCILNYAEHRTRKWRWLLTATLAAALYTHYVPGIALLIAANLMFFRKRRLADAVQVDSFVVLAYLPWIGWLWQSISRWGHQSEVYLVTGTSILELPVRLAFWLLSFTVGESQPDAGMIAGVLAIPMILWLLAAGIRRNQELAWIAIPCSLIGVIGVARWVTYPFLPARLLFTCPLLLVLVFHGGLFHRRIGRAAWAAVMILSVVGIGCYFQRTGFRNKEYPMPIREITTYIEQHSTRDDSVVLVDSTNSDLDAVDFAMAGSRRRLRTSAPETSEILAQVLADPQIHSVWFLRNTHDISASHLDNHFERQIGAVMKPTVHPYEPFSPLETRAMRLVGIDPPPVWFHYLIEYRR